jgi:hypothetical protein
MTDSPPQGLSTTGAPALEHAPPTRAEPDQPEPHRITFSAPKQRAPSGVGVKDLRPLRGRPCGPIPDPDASSRRAHKQAESRRKKINNTGNGG